MVIGYEFKSLLHSGGWQRYAGQWFYDEQGVFISTILNAPLLCQCFVQMVSPQCLLSLIGGCLRPSLDNEACVALSTP